MPRAKKPVKRQGAKQVKKQEKTIMAENNESATATMTAPEFENGPPPDIESVNDPVSPEIKGPTAEPSTQEKAKPAVAKTPPPAAPAETPAPAAPKMTVISTDPVIAMLQRKASVSAQELHSLSAGGKPGSRDILVGGVVQFRDGRGYERERPRTLMDANPHLMYAFVSPESLKSDIVFMNGWFPVTATNDGGFGCPDHYFGQDGFIFRGESCMVWTTREFFERGVRDRERKLQDSQVSGLTGSKIDGKSNGVNQQISVTEDH